MRRDDEGGVLAAGDGDRDGWRQMALGAAAVDHLADGTDVDGVALKHLDQGLFELGGADGVEQLQKPGDRAADVIAALGDDAQECLAAAGGAGEAIEASVLAGAPLLGDQALDVLGLLDLLAAVPRPDVGRDVDAAAACVTP
ncbi:hypothetical protein [Sorangium sp. So ce542]|uniref:hypothetical protein n=1 Tax=Sorangium sp. So ce542 TaxID=3133316 RepID=UPI003F5E28CB